MVKRKSALNHIFAVTYNAKGQVQQATHADTSVVLLTPQDSRALVNDVPAGTGTFCSPAPVTPVTTPAATWIDSRGKEWTYRLNGYGDILTERDPIGRQKTYVRTASNQVTEMTRANGTLVVFTYGSRGELTREQDFGRLTLGAPATTIHRYSAAYTIRTQTVDSLGNATAFELDADGNVVRHVTAEGQETVRTFDGRGLLTLERDPVGNETRYQHDTEGNRVKQINPDGSEVLTPRNAAGYIEKRVDEDGHETRYTYTPYGLLTRIDDAEGFHREMLYDVDRRLTRLIDD